MTPSLLLLASWLFFGGSHLVLSSSRLRRQLSERFGPTGFIVSYTGVTIVSMLTLIVVTAIYGGRGRPGIQLDQSLPMRYLLLCVGAAGALLIVAGLMTYARSAIARLAQRQPDQQANVDWMLHKPGPVERVTRHPFFVGLVMLMAAHAMLASTLAGAVYFGGFAVLAQVGMPLQDKKLRDRWGKPYIEYQRQTTVVPRFSAIFVRADCKKHPLKIWGASAVIAAILFSLLHPVWAYANGALFAGAILLFGTVGVVTGLTRRPRSSAKQHPG